MIARQLFGRTGHQSTRTIFGGAALSKVTQDEADQTPEVLVRYGVRLIPCGAYQGGRSLGIILQGRPEQRYRYRPGPRMISLKLNGFDDIGNPLATSRRHSQPRHRYPRSFPQMPCFFEVTAARSRLSTETASSTSGT